MVKRDKKKTKRKPVIRKKKKRSSSVDATLEVGTGLGMLAELAFS